MDRNVSGYSRAVDTDVYEYRNDNFLPIDTLGQANLGALFPPASSDELSLQGTGSSQQSSLLNFYKTSTSQHSSLTSSSQGVGVVRYFFVSQNIDWLWYRNMGFCVNRFTGVSHNFCPLTGQM